jgi:hypothetical protein
MTKYRIVREGPWIIVEREVCGFFGCFWEREKSFSASIDGMCGEDDIHFFNTKEAMVYINNQHPKTSVIKEVLV